MLSRADLTLAQRSHFFRPPLFIHEAITVKHLKLTTETTGTKSYKPGETCATIVTTLNQDKENWLKIFERSRRCRSPTLTLSAIVALLVDASANKHHLAVPVNAVSIYPALTQLMAESSCCLIAEITRMPQSPVHSCHKSRWLPARSPA